mgnify:CR=1 FL=1
MLEKEYPRLVRKGLEEGLRFWGLDVDTDKDTLISFISNINNILKGISKLEEGENRVLTFLLMKNGKAEKDDLRSIIQSEKELEKAITGLEKKFFIYVRKDRSTLTDRHDKLYVYPVILSKLTEIPVIEEDKFGPFLDKYYEPLYKSCNVPRSVIESLRYGGIIFGGDVIAGSSDLKKTPDISGFSTYLLYLRGCFYPFYLPPITELESEQDIREGSFQRGFIFSDYIIKVILICDIFHHFPKIRKAGIKKRMGSLGFSISDGEYASILDDLNMSGVIDVSERRVNVSTMFLYGNYSEKIRCFESILGEDERNVIEEVRKRSTLRVDILTSILVRNLRLKERRFSLTDEIAAEIYKNYSDKLERIITLGFIERDFSRTFLRASELECRIPEKKFLQINADGEIFVYTELMNGYAYYLLCGFARLISVEKILKFKLDKDSVIRGVVLFASADEFIDMIKNCSIGKPEPYVVETIKAWACEGSKIKIGQRYVLRIDERLKLKIMGSDKLRGMVELVSGDYIIFREDTDVERLKGYLRDENIFID